jgi:membrane protease YdiL (CAAX protease family)
MKTKHNVLTFVLITFGFSWLFWVPEALIAQKIWIAPEAVQRFVGLNLGGWGPLVGAIVTTLIYQRFAGLKELFKRGVMVRLGKWWWVTLLIFPVLIGGSLGLALLFGSPTPDFPAVAEAAQAGAPLPVYLLIAFVAVFFTSGPLQEEFGWRGYVVENLKNKYSALTAAVIAGLLWGSWHAPLFFANRSEPYYTNPAWGLMLTTLLVGIILAWIYINTKGSIFAAMLGHAMFNWTNYVFPALDVDAAGLILFVLYFLVVGYILWQYGAKTFLKAKS